MSQVEYKVIPAPTRGVKRPGIKTPEGRFALGLEDTLNEMARAGWHYLRSDILPSVERQGLTSSHTVYRSVLVFQRVIPDEDLAATPSFDSDPPLERQDPGPDTAKARE
ncbi:MAG: hypothetical protein ACQEUH_10385 [Pseudomonadota bacterium]